ncbi:MAG: hypothetical protein ACO3CC_17590, partial [Alphaproteobacteria bacterium]
MGSPYPASIILQGQNILFANSVGIYTLNGGTAFSRVTSYSAAAYISQNSATAQTVFTYWGSNS